jgi:UDP-glucuronate decarboxylase
VSVSIIEQDIKKIVDADLPWDNFANKTVLVSGASGFLPAYMIETLLYLNDKHSLNIKIIGLVRNIERANCRFKKYISHSDLVLLEQDVSKPFTYNEKIDFIIHAASQASPKYYGQDPVGTLLANVLGTYHLLELAKINKIEDFLYFSSGEVYGENNENQIPLSETMYGYIDPLNTRACYAESKRMGENMLVSYAHQFNVPVKIVRPFHTYGPGLRLDDGRVFSDFIADIIHNRDIMLLGDGSAVRAFCYLVDATIGFFTVLLKGENAQAYNIGNPSCAMSVLELATRLATHFKEKNIIVNLRKRENQSGYLTSQIISNIPDITKAIDIGWQPSISIEEGFSRTVESFNESV